MKELRVIILFIICLFSAGSHLSATGNSTKNDGSNLIGEWVAQIDIPQNDLIIVMSFEFLDNENCIVKCKWVSDNGRTLEESGNAIYSLSNNQLTITFPDEEELIRTDNVFSMENVYNIKLENNQLIILNNRQFRNTDIYFGKGHDNRGFSKIIF